LSDEQIGSLQSGVEPLVLAVSRYLRDRLRWVDQIGRWEDNIFVLVLPETGKDETDGLVDKIRNEQTNMLLPAPFDETRPSLSFGTAYWQKGDDMRTLLRRATQQLADE
jgi:GGDEF domain-containing protein